MLKKLLLITILFPLLSFSGSQYFKPDQETIKLEDMPPPILIEKQYRYVVEPQYYFSTKISYPQITDKSGTSIHREFNEAVLKIIKTEQTEFDKYFQFTKQLLKEDSTKNIPPLPMDTNYLTIQYELANPKKNLISVRFTINLFTYGMAHPANFTKVVNYDFSTKKVLELKDLFKPDSNYLQKIANYSKDVLTKRLAPYYRNLPMYSKKFEENTFEKGIAANEKNYNNWNIVVKGLLITFEGGQVASYQFGREEVLIPNKVLQKDWLFASLR